MQDFDVVVIGSGPAALAALDGLAGAPRVGVVTGAVPSVERRSTLHPKIQAVSLARAEAAGVAERVLAPRKGRPLFSTAAVGGLANYWGQQFVRWGEADPWPRDAFANFAAYERACDHVERLFVLEGGEPLGTTPFGDDYSAVRPRLLAGSADGAGAGLEAMRRAFEGRVAAGRARVFPHRVHSMVQSGSRWAVVLDDGTSLSADRILLGAGVVGDGQILLRSFPDLSGFDFMDHTPWLLFTLGATVHFPELLPGARPFNAFTLRRDTSAGCELFSSFYDMRGADLNLLLASTLGYTHPWLRRRRSPPGAGLVTPVQVWTPDTYGRVQITASRQGLALTPATPAPIQQDPGLDRFIAILRQVRIRILSAKATTPSAGYHYHRLRLRGGDETWTEVADLLRDRTGGSVTCIDAADLRQIGCQPHTLTLMARALVRARDLIATGSSISPREPMAAAEPPTLPRSGRPVAPAG
ncbi:MAG: hypothetical protein ACRYGP_06670 [Janthinobacterium lividum]